MNIKNTITNTCSSKLDDTQQLIIKDWYAGHNINIINNQTQIVSSMTDCIQYSTSGASMVEDFARLTKLADRTIMKQYVDNVVKQVAKEKLKSEGPFAALFDMLGKVGTIIAIVVGGLSGLCYVVISCVAIGLVIFMIVKAMGGKKGTA